jgi:hypothetical protein
VGTGIQSVPRKTSTKKVEDLSGGGLISTNNLLLILPDKDASSG